MYESELLNRKCYHDTHIKRRIYLLHKCRTTMPLKWKVKALRIVQFAQLHLWEKSMKHVRGSYIKLLNVRREIFPIPTLNGSARSNRPIPSSFLAKCMLSLICNNTRKTMLVLHGRTLFLLRNA